MQTNIVSKKLLEPLGNSGIPERVSAVTFDKAMEKRDDIIDSVRNIQVEHDLYTGDDFIPNTKLYNALGAIYSSLPRNVKDRALRAYLAQMVGLNYISIQDNHTPYIHEPLALADICAVHHDYWPGMNLESSIVGKFDDFKTFQKKLMGKNDVFKKGKTRSDFILAYAVLRKDMSKFGNDFIDACNPVFLERVVEGIVTMRFAHRETTLKDKERRARLREILPKKIHTKVTDYFHQKDWPNPEEFM